MTGLAHNEIEILKKIFRQTDCVKRAVLFGSRAMGLHRHNSDVDIALYGDGITMRDILKINARIEQTTMPYMFDFVLGDNANEALTTHIKTYGKAIYESTGTTVVGIKAAELRQVEIDLPDLDAQRAIAATLRALDDKIAVNTKLSYKLEQMAQAIFKSWFVDFEPFGGVMPDDWREGTLSEISAITMGQSPEGSSYNEDGIGTVFYQGRAEFSSRFPTRRLFTVQPKRMAVKGDVLLSVRTPVGDINVAHESCCLGRGLAGIQSNNGCQSFVLYTMFALKQQLDMFNGEGTVFGSINKNDMASLPVLIPSDNVFRQFEELIGPMDATIEANYAENCNLQATRDSLLPRLMSGELSVVDIGDYK